MAGTKATADLIPRYRSAPFVFPYTLAPPLNNLFFAFARTLSDLLAARQLSRADGFQERIRRAGIRRCYRRYFPKREGDLSKKQRAERSSVSLFGYSRCKRDQERILPRLIEWNCKYTLAECLTFRYDNCIDRTSYHLPENRCRSWKFRCLPENTRARGRDS